MPPQRPIAVAYVFLDFDEGGAQRLALTWWRLFDRTRVQPTLVCLRGHGALVEEALLAGVPVHLMHRLQRPWDLEAVGRLARVLRRARVDVVHVATYSRAAPYAVAAARLAQVPVIVAHAHWRPEHPRGGRRVADRLLRGGVRFLAVSASERDRLLAEGADPAAITVLPNGIEARFFAHHDQAACRERLALETWRPVVAVPSRLVPRKGHVDYLSALPRVLRAAPDTLTLFAGEGPLRDTLRALVDAAGLTRAVRFLGHQADMVPVYAAADVVALPSRAEGMPLALMEAMAGGIPAVATRVGGVEEVLDDGRTGLLVPPGDAAGLAAALVRLLSDRSLRSRLGAAARATARERFRGEAMARSLTGLYEDWVSTARVTVET